MASAPRRAGRGRAQGPRSTFAGRKPRPPSSVRSRPGATSCKS